MAQEITDLGLSPLTVGEASELAACEAAIDRAETALHGARQAFLRIRDGRLYRATHLTFEAYCEDRWGRSASHGHRMAREAAALENVARGPHSILPESGRALRALSLVPDEHQVDVWGAALKDAGGKPATGPQVEAAAARFAQADAGSDNMDERAAAFWEQRRDREAAAPGASLLVTRTPEAVDHGPELIIARGPEDLQRIAKQLRVEDRKQKLVHREQLHQAIAVGNRDLDFGDRRFAIVFPDPPWRYDNKTNNGAAEGHYPTMSLDEICRMPVERHATTDAACFLWVPAPLARDGFEVLEAWGFRYVTQRVWLKPRRRGMGSYTFTDHELIYLGVRGSMVPVWRECSWFEAPLGEHSAKPDEPYEVAEKMYPGGPYLEMFSRAGRPGWEAWGNQAEEETPCLD